VPARLRERADGAHRLQAFEVCDGLSIVLYENRAAEDGQAQRLCRGSSRLSGMVLVDQTSMRLVGEDIDGSLERTNWAGLLRSYTSRQARFRPILYFKLRGDVESKG